MQKLQIEQAIYTELQHEPGWTKFSSENVETYGETEPFRKHCKSSVGGAAMQVNCTEHGYFPATIAPKSFLAS